MLTTAQNAEHRTQNTKARESRESGESSNNIDIDTTTRSDEVGEDGKSKAHIMALQYVRRKYVGCTLQPRGDFLDAESPTRGALSGLVMECRGGGGNQQLVSGFVGQYF